MNNLKIIFVNWTKPFFHKQQFTGYKKNISVVNNVEEYYLLDYEIVMQVASITSAKRYSSAPVKLYTDDCGLEYYTRIGLIDLFDEVDTDLLNGLNNDDSINPAQFWTSGKIISICNEKPPFIFMDLDLILKNHIPEWFKRYDVIHTHWEMCRGPLFINHWQLQEYNLDIPNFNERMLIPNTSFLYVNDQKVLDKYLDLHLKIVKQKYDKVPDWLWLMSDQHILGYVLRELNTNVADIQNEIYIQFCDEYHDEGKVGHVPKWIPLGSVKKQDPQLPYEHVWLDKAHIINNPDHKVTKIMEWKKIAIENGYGRYVSQY